MFGIIANRSDIMLNDRVISPTYSGPKSRPSERLSLGEKDLAMVLDSIIIRGVRASMSHNADRAEMISRGRS